MDRRVNRARNPMLKWGRDRLLSVCLVLLVLGPVAAADDGFVPLFNGRDLSGWVNVNGAAGTFYAQNNELIITGQPIALLRTERMYENFILEAEWMHVEKSKMANSGIFIWADPLPGVGSPFTSGIEVQVLINYKPADGWATSHGDLFSVQRAVCKPDRPHPKGLMRCLPSEERVKGAGEWNHYRITANNGVVKLEVNGKEVSGLSECKPRKGYLMIESEGVECHFRNLTIKELPSTNPTAEETAYPWQGHQKLFDALSMEGWSGASWRMNSGVFRCTGPGPLTSTTAYGPGELLFDWKMPARAATQAVTLELDGQARTFSLPSGTKPGTWTRVTVPLTTAGPITFRGSEGLEVMNVYLAPAK